MMSAKMIILLPIVCLHFVGAQQLQLGDIADRLWFLSVPAPRSSSSCPCLFGAGRITSIRDDYTYTPGIGAHKVHKRPLTWFEARRTCIEEGGHLAIINSVAEADVIWSHLNRTGPVRGTNTDWVYIGFHDLYEQGDYVTVHDQSLSQAGFTEWASGQPDNSPGGLERCGSVYKNGRLNDLGCNQKRIFICELPV